MMDFPIIVYPTVSDVRWNKKPLFKPRFKAAINLVVPWVDRNSVHEKCINKGLSF